MNINELLNSLDNLSAWRKKELLQAHSLARNASNNDTIRYLCRAWVLVMYAHCDNFLKESTRTYLEYLKSNINIIPRTRYKQELLVNIKRKNYSNQNNINRS